MRRTHGDEAPQAKQGVFASKDERDRWQIETYGAVRNGFREEYEQEDGRPALRILEPPWADKTEQLAYEDAAETDRPRPEDTLLSYLARVSAAVKGKYGGVLPKMRRPGLSRVERERRVQQLRGQLPGKTEVL